MAQSEAQQNDRRGPDLVAPTVPATEEVYSVKDSGTRREFPTGAHRDMAGGKGRYDLIPRKAKKAVALVYEAGARKYSDNNWRRGIPYSSLLDSAQRHIDQWAEGQTDEIHLAHAVFNLMSLLEFEAEGRTDLDDVHYPKELYPDGPPKSPISMSAEEYAEIAGDYGGKILRTFLDESRNCRLVDEMQESPAYQELVRKKLHESLGLVAPPPSFSTAELDLLKMKRSQQDIANRVGERQGTPPNPDWWLQDARRQIPDFDAKMEQYKKMQQEASWERTESQERVGQPQQGAVGGSSTDSPTPTYRIENKGELTETISPVIPEARVGQGSAVDGEPMSKDYGDVWREYNPRRR